MTATVNDACAICMRRGAAFSEKGLSHCTCENHGTSRAGAPAPTGRKCAPRGCQRLRFRTVNLLRKDSIRYLYQQRVCGCGKQHGVHCSCVLGQYPGGAWRNIFDKRKDCVFSVLLIQPERMSYSVWRAAGHWLWQLLLLREMEHPCDRCF